jgi:hypothetical protein
LYSKWTGYTNNGTRRSTTAITASIRSVDQDTTARRAELIFDAGVSVAEVEGAGGAAGEGGRTGAATGGAVGGAAGEGGRTGAAIGGAVVSSYKLTEMFVGLRGEIELDRERMRM